MLAGAGLGALLFMGRSNGESANMSRFKKCLDPNMPTDLQKEFADALAIWMGATTHTDDHRASMVAMANSADGNGYPLAAACVRNMIAGTQL